MDATDERSLLDRDIRFAIAHRRLVELSYLSRRRVVEPHDYGIQNGVARLLVYQIRGESSGRIPAWRDLDLSKIERLVVLEQTFRGSRGARHHRHQHWDVLFARVE